MSPPRPCFMRTLYTAALGMASGGAASAVNFSAPKTSPVANGWFFRMKAAAPGVSRENEAPGAGTFVFLSPFIVCPWSVARNRSGSPSGRTAAGRRVRRTTGRLRGLCNGWIPVRYADFVVLHNNDFHILILALLCDTMKATGVRLPARLWRWDSGCFGWLRYPFIFYSLSLRMRPTDSRSSSMSSHLSMSSSIALTSISAVAISFISSLPFVRGSPLPYIIYYLVCFVSPLYKIFKTFFDYLSL